MCKKFGVGVLTYSSLQQGLLTGRYTAVDELRPGLSRTRHFHHSRSDKCRHKVPTTDGACCPPPQPPCGPSLTCAVRGVCACWQEEGCEEALFAPIAGMRSLAEELGVSMAALALAWVVQQPQVRCCVGKARGAMELESC